MTNAELEVWRQKFEALEGIDIYSAAAVAAASLEMAVREGTVGKDEVIMLNITGGGEKRCKAETKTVQAQPDLVLDPSLDASVIIEKVSELFK